MNKKLKTILVVATVGISVAASADSLMFNYSQLAGNDIATPGEVGVDALVNVQGGGGTQVGTLDGVGYSMTHGDYWQFNHVAQLGQPYGAVLEDNVIVTLTGLSAWLTANGDTEYEVNLFYAGTGGNVDSYIAANSVTVGGITETVTFSHAGSTDSSFWAADGATHTLATDTLIITDTATSFAGGISAIQITSIPEPGTLGMVALFGGGILIIRRNKLGL